MDPDTLEVLYEPPGRPPTGSRWADAARTRLEPVPGSRYDPKVIAANAKLRGPGSIGAVLAPYVQKAANGEKLTPAEQAVLDRFKPFDVLQAMMQMMLGGGATSTSAGVPGAGGEADLLSKAREVLAQGANRGAVEQRLRENGVDQAKL